MITCNTECNSYLQEFHTFLLNPDTVQSGIHARRYIFHILKEGELLFTNVIFSRKRYMPVVCYIQRWSSCSAAPGGRGSAARGASCRTWHSLHPPGGQQPLGLLLLSGSALRGLQTASGGRCLGRRGGDHQQECGSSSLLAALLNSYNCSVALVNKAALLYLILHIFEIKKEAVGAVSKCLFKSQITGSEIQSQGAAFKGI